MTATAVIDRAAFERNVARLVAHVAPAEVMLAVKADAYGHGMVDLATVALQAGANSLAVLEIPAAIQLRERGIRNRLFAWLHGDASDFASAVQAEIDLGVSTLRELSAIAAWGTPEKPGRVHLKIDTGLHRNGALPEAWPALVQQARDYERSGRIVIEGIWSHLADTSPEDDTRAIAAFDAALHVAAELDARPPLRHLAASSAGLREPRARYDLVRFGIAAYGISPFDDRSGADLGLEAVMSLTSTASSDTAPAGHAWIAAGYGDGVPAVVDGAEVLVDGIRVPVVRVEVDRTLIAVAQPVLGTAPVTVFGDPSTGAPSAEDWARWAGTIGDEVVTGAGGRAARHVIA